MLLLAISIRYTKLKMNQIIHPNCIKILLCKEIPLIESQETVISFWVSIYKVEKVE